MTKLKAQKKSVIRNEKGLATLETVPLLAIFVILLAYSFGAFGVIHTGILNSVAARTYAFETMRGRTNVTYFRDNVMGPAPIDSHHFMRKGNRIHGIRHEDGPGALGFRATERPIRIGFGGIAADPSRNNASIHNERIFSDVVEQVQTQVGVSPVWVMTQYGMCINATCGGE